MRFKYMNCLFVGVGAWSADAGYQKSEVLLPSLLFTYSKVPIFTTQWFPFPCRVRGSVKVC